MAVDAGGGLRGGGPLGGPGCWETPGLGEDHVGVGWPFTREARGAGGPWGGLIMGPIGGPFMVGKPGLGGPPLGGGNGPGGLPGWDHAGGLAGGPWGN